MKRFVSLAMVIGALSTSGCQTPAGGNPVGAEARASQSNGRLGGRPRKNVRA